MSIRRNTAYNLLGSLLPLVVSLVTIPLFLKLIGAERYGTLAILWALMGYFGFMDLGLGRAITQRLASSTGRSPYRRSGLVWTALILTTLLGAIAGVILWLSADYILSRWIEMTPQNLDEAKGAIPWFVAAMPLILSASILTGALHGRQRFLAMNVLGVTGSTLSQLLPLAVASLGHVGLNWLVPAALSARLITFAINFRYCRRNLPLRGRPHFQPEHIKPLLSYGGWISLMSIMAPLLVTIDRLVIGAMAGAKAVAFYTVPYSIVTRPLAIPGSLHSALFPRIAGMQEQDTKGMVDKTSCSLVTVMTILVLSVIPLVHPFLIFWVGGDFAAQSKGVGEVLLLGVLINSIVYPHHSRLMAIGKLRLIVVIYLFELPIYCLLLWAGLTQFGILGAALAWTLRILLDSTLLLVASSMLRQGVVYSLPPITLTTISVLVSLMLPVDSTLRWLLSMLLVCLAIWLGRLPLIEMLTIIKRRKTVSTT